MRGEEQGRAEAFSLQRRGPSCPAPLSLTRVAVQGTRESGCEAQARQTSRRHRDPSSRTASCQPRLRPTHRNAIGEKRRSGRASAAMPTRPARAAAGRLRSPSSRASQSATSGCRQQVVAAERDASRAPVERRSAIARSAIERMPSRRAQPGQRGSVATSATSAHSSSSASKSSERSRRSSRLDAWPAARTAASAPGGRSFRSRNHGRGTSSPSATDPAGDVGKTAVSCVAVARMGARSSAMRPQPAQKQDDDRATCERRLGTCGLTASAAIGMTAIRSTASLP